MDKYKDLIQQLNDTAFAYNVAGRGVIAGLLSDAADAIEELTAKVEALEHDMKEQSGGVAIDLRNVTETGSHRIW